MNLYPLTVPHFDRALQNMERWIDNAIDFAKEKKFEPNDLLSARLAPDQFPLLRQVQSACDGAKLACARITGKEAPVHPDVEKTWDELRTRIRSVREYIGGFKPADFEDADTRHQCRRLQTPGPDARYRRIEDREDASFQLTTPRHRHCRSGCAMMPNADDDVEQMVGVVARTRTT